MEKERSAVQVPRAVTEAIVQHRREGGIGSHRVPWKREWWDRANLPLLRDAIDRVAALSEPAEGGWLLVSRGAVLSLAPEGEGGSPWPLFAGTMIWGYGDRGFGASRTSKILWSTKREAIEANLLEVVAAARQGPAQAWDAFVGANRTYLFGSAFATKFAYFAAWARKPAATTQRRVLIADVNTSWAMWHLCQLPRSGYTKAGYLRYVDLAHQWATDGGWRADEVERALFDIGKTVPRRP